MLSTLLAAGAVSVGVQLLVWGAGKLANKTSNKVDDAIVAYVRANAGTVVAAIEKALSPSKAKVDVVSRERVRDHR
jgi:hypothetical protein